MQRYGIDVKHAERLEMIGVPGPVNIARTLLAYGRDDIDPAMPSRERQELYLVYLKTRTIPLMPGALEILTWVKEKNIPRIIASSSTREQIQTTIAQTALRDYFSSYVSFENVKRGKPFPDTYIEAARQVGVHPKYCAAFDDAAAGVDSAKAAGCFTIAVPNEYTEGGNFSMADLAVRSLAEVDCVAIFAT